jgi:hypothetical protein
MPDMVIEARNAAISDTMKVMQQAHRSERRILLKNQNVLY